MPINRREFMKLTGVTVLCTCVGAGGVTACSGISFSSDTPLAPAGSYRVEGDKVILALSQVDSLQNVGGAVKFALRNSAGSELKLLVVRSDEGAYHAFSDRCTHGGNELNYVYEESKLRCSSLGHSQFDLAGNVLKGPARGMLTRYPLQREGDELVIEV